MYVFLGVLYLFIIFALIVFLPAISHHLKEIHVERQFLEQIKQLEDFYGNKLQVVEQPLGTGSIQNSDISFCVAHQNQEFAVASVMNLINQLGD